MTLKTISVLVGVIALAGCYTKKVEKIERTTPERQVIIHDDRDARGMITREQETTDSIDGRRRKTVIEERTF